MADNKNYYYLKLKDNFFDSDEIKILEKMPNGYKYSNILLKLYLKSLKFQGALRLNEYIPYNLEMISALTGHDIDTVRVAVDIFQGLKLTETLDNGTIYMLNIQSLIGRSSTEADRKREYRIKIEEEKKLLSSGTNSGQMSDKNPNNSDKTPPEIEIELDIDIEKEIEIELEKEQIPWKEILIAWNDLPAPIKPIKAITDTRKNKVRARVNSLNITAQDILKAINNIHNSSFVQGNNDKQWVIDFDWLFKDDTRFTKVFEGKYSNKKPASLEGKEETGGKLKQDNQKDTGKFAGFKPAEANYEDVDYSDLI